MIKDLSNSEIECISGGILGHIAFKIFSYGLGGFVTGVTLTDEIFSLFGKNVFESNTENTLQINFDSQHDAIRFDEQTNPTRKLKLITLAIGLTTMGLSLANLLIEG